MFSGELQMIELKCKNGILEEIFDRFGEKINTRRYDDDSFLLRTEASLSKGLASWIMQFGGDIQVVSPPELKNMVRDKAEQIYELYSTENKDE